MRAAFALSLALAACSPEFASGAYNCGPNASCPPGEACNIDTTCVAAGTEMAFACASNATHEPDDTPAQAFPVPISGCVSNQVQDNGCLAAGDGMNWVSFATPGNCAAVAIEASIVFPLAFETLAMRLTDATGTTTLGTSGACAQDPTSSASEAAACLKTTLANGTMYALQVAPAGGGDCGGSCNYNDYTLTLQFVTP